ncbi:hypothetical protein FOZ61_000278 [Perkinsus olseni]|uniref:Uncharacterized protein n=1 Tax=Perkinsus olseni TaxID=32597 RepID=A0A7J6KV64_PEROL|nr:hypothetical protein FOZ61_000278 [Perkinsus olseni]
MEEYCRQFYESKTTVSSCMMAVNQLWVFVATMAMAPDPSAFDGTYRFNEDGVNLTIYIVSWTRLISITVRCDNKDYKSDFTMGEDRWKTQNFFPKRLGVYRGNRLMTEEYIDIRTRAQREHTSLFWDKWQDLKSFVRENCDVSTGLSDLMAIVKLDSESSAEDVPGQSQVIAVEWGSKVIFLATRPKILLKEPPRVDSP